MSRPLTCVALLALVGALLYPAAVAAQPPPAGAWPVVRNAQQLSGRETKIGLWGFDIGLHERVQIGTLWVPWLIVSPNIHLKIGIVEHGRYALSLDTSFFYFKLDHLEWYGIDDFTGGVSILPVGLRFDVEATERLLVGVGVEYTFVRTDPSYDPQDFEGTGAYDNLVMSGQITGRLSPRWYLVGEVDWVLWQGLVAVGTVQGQPDEYTTVTGSAEANVEAIEPARGGSISISALYRMRRFGFRLGVGYGNWVIPRIQLAVPNAIPFFLFDIYARFGGGDRSASADPGASADAPVFF